MTFQSNENLSARKERLVHKGGHVGWMKDAACKKQTAVDGHTMM